MTSAVVLVTAPAVDGRPAALLPWDVAEGGSVLARLLGQLASLGVRRPLVLARPAWADEVLRAAPDARVQASPDVAQDLRRVADLAASEAVTVAGSAAGLVVLPGELVCHREALAGLLVDPRVATGMLTGPARGGWVLGTRSARGRVVSAESPYHALDRRNGTFLGVLQVSGRDAATLAAAARELADLVGDPAWEAELDRKAGLWRFAVAAAREQGLEPSLTGARPVADQLTAVALALSGGVPLDDLAPTQEQIRSRRPVGGRLGDDADPSQLALGPDDEALVQERVAVARTDVPALLLTGLVRAGVAVSASHLRELWWSRPLSRESLDAARAGLAAVDEDDVLLASAVKGSDGFFTTFFVSPYSRYIARYGAGHGWTPNGVTSASMLLGVVSALCFALGDRLGLVLGAVLLQAAFTLDCVDGQLARYTRRFSKLGAWLDSVFDRGKEYVVYAGLAVGSTRGGYGDVWVLAGAALALQTFRHTVEFSFAAVQHREMATVAQPPLRRTQDGVLGPDELTTDAAGPRAEVTPGGAGLATALRAQAPATAVTRSPLQRLGVRAIQVSRRSEGRPALRYLKKMVILPIGERFALISLTAALSVPRTTFLALLAWGALAFLYSGTGRALRSFAR